MKRIGQFKWAGIALALAVSNSVAKAETLPVEGVYGAGADIPAVIEVIAIERFGGDQGYDLEERLSEILNAPVLDDLRFYRVIPASLAQRERLVVVDRSADGAVGEELVEIIGPDNGPDALLRGSASSRVSDYRTDPKIERECARRDEKKKCVEYREIRIPCRRVEVTFSADVNLLATDGKRLYDNRDSYAANRRYCRDESARPNPDTMIGELAARFARAVERDMLPEYRRSEPRLLEQRKGLAKADRRAFKQALKLTKNDPFGACLGFRNLETANPDHMSVLFNIGLCHESENSLEEAAYYYQRVLDLEPGKSYPEAGLQRIASRNKGDRQLAEREAIHEARMSKPSGDSGAIDAALDAQP